MNISKKSWHYHLIKWLTPEKKLVGGELPQMSFCRYWGEVVMFLASTPMIAIFLAVFCLFVLPIIALGDWLDKWANRRKGLSPREPRTLLGKWLKAKKEKICPMLTWVDD